MAQDLADRTVPDVATVLARACDCHVHVFDPERFPYAPERSYSPGKTDVTALTSFLNAMALERVVLVQPSVYGADNRCLLDALSVLGPARARGVAVIDPATSSPEQVCRLRAAGIRGLRVNLEAKGVRRGEALTTAVESVAPLAAAGDMFVQIYADLPTIAASSETLAALPVPVVLDHFAGAKAELGLQQTGFAALRRLVDTGKTWIKLSAPYRVSHDAGYRDCESLARELLHIRPDRMIWASDWPHTGGGKTRLERAAGEVEPFREIDNALVLDLLSRWAGDITTFRKVLSDNPAELFGF